MLKIRLQRVGRKNDASFRVIVTESQRGPKAGKNVEIVGFYDPKRDISELKKDRVEYWMGVGAQVSDTVHNLLVNEGIVKGKKINVLPKKSPIVDEEALKKEAEEKAKAEAEAAAAKEEAEAPAEEAAPEVETTEEKTEEEAPKEETPAEAPVEETPSEEASEETPKEEEAK